MIFWAGLKLFFSGFNLRNLTLYALLGTIILSLAMYLLWKNEKTSHELTTKELELFVSELEKNKLENDRLQVIRDKKYQELEKDYKVIKQEREKISKGLKDEINRTGSLLNSIGLLKNSSSNSGLPKDEIPTELPSEVGRECNSTIARLIEAGKSCAVDYNTLHEAWMIQCDTFGCEN